MSEVWINDVDLGPYGFVMGQHPGHTSSPEFTDATAQLAGQVGPVWLAERVQAAARRLLVAGSVKAATAAAYQTAIDQLKELASIGAVRLRFADRVGQEFRDCRLISFVASSASAILSNANGNVAITFEAADPLRYDVQPQGIPLSTARAPMPIGTAPSLPFIVIHGGGSGLVNPTLTYRSAAGDVEQTMGLTASLGANDYVVIDCVRTRITKSVSGVVSDAT
ncbi:MAG TPA: hypothetical protein VIP11_18115, partial [Gemmatimonadaceae bacterium]